MSLICNGERERERERDERNNTAYPPAVMAGCIDRTKCSWKHDKLEALFARPFIGRVACVRAYELASPQAHTIQAFYALSFLSLRFGNFATLTLTSCVVTRTYITFLQLIHRFVLPREL